MSKSFYTEAKMFKIKNNQKIYISGINFGDTMDTSVPYLSLDEHDAMILDLKVWNHFINNIPALSIFSLEKNTTTEIFKYE